MSIPYIYRTSVMGQQDSTTTAPRYNAYNDDTQCNALKIPTATYNTVTLRTGCTVAQQQPQQRKHQGNYG